MGYGMQKGYHLRAEPLPLSECNYLNPLSLSPGA
jgi:hypothetical protein